MASAITPEVIGLDVTAPLLDTDLTPTELARVTASEIRIKTADATILEQRLIEGEELFRIQAERLYRSREPGERFTWEQYLARFTRPLTKSGKGFGKEAAQLRCLLYLFHSWQIPGQRGAGREFPLPSGTDHLKPLLAKAPSRNASQGGGFDVDGDWTAVLEIWKAAIAKNPSPDKRAVAAARNAYEQNQLRAGASPGRMPSTAKLKTLAKGREVAAANREEAAAARPATVAIPEAAPATAPAAAPAAAAAPAPAPTVPAWELERDPDALDAGAECKRVWSAFNEAARALATLRGILYSQTAKYGSIYLETLRTIDAGAYSLHNIDEKAAGLQEDADFIAQVLAWEGEAGALNRSTVDVEAFPTR